VSTTMVWTASQSGGTGALVYKWFISPDGGTSWTAAGPWAPSNQLTWTPTVANANYRVAVWAKRASNVADSGEASTESAFAITERAVGSVTLTSNVASPQPVSTAIVWTAAQNGGTGAIVFKWFVSNDGGASWTATGPWAASNQLAWTPTVASANYRVAVWAKRASNAADSGEASAEGAFVIAERPVASVTLTSNLASPQAVSTAIVWTATQSGGTGALVYKWFISDDGGTSWTATGPFGTSNQLAWAPTVANANYRVAVWVKRASNDADSAEAASDQAFAITPPPSGPVSAVLLAANLAAPQPASTSIVFTATAIGGDGNHVYKWFVFDGTNWTAAAPWSSSAQLTWTPTSVNPNYRIAVWVKRASNPVDDAEAAAESAFAIRPSNDR